MTGLPPHLAGLRHDPGCATATTPYWRHLLAWLLLATFLLLPWLRIDGQPALLVDIGQRQLFLLGHALGSQHAPGLIALSLAMAAGLYLLTNLGGRLWCGFACPQTVLGQLHSDLLRRIGPAPTRVAWALLAVATGISFVGYFLPLHSLLTPPFNGWGPWSLFWAGFYGLATWANIAYLKTRVCTDLCPFARLQPWIGDARTPHVQYQAPRGEPRGPRPDDLPDIATRGRRLLDPETARDYVVRAANPELAGPLPQFPAKRLGDCTDCGLCLRQCPLGLDIRNGHDARCLDCGRCIDACNSQMQARGYARGLIARRPRPCMEVEQRAPRWRPRPLLAGAVMLLALATSWLLA